MASITTRHIRHDWPEWVDWHTQKSVKTMCGVRSRPGLCGIPGITEQESVVEKNGRKVWGWCMNCVRATFPYYLPPALTLYVTSPEIIALHKRSRETILPQYLSLLHSQLADAEKRGATGAIRYLKEEIAKLTAPS